MFQVDLDDRGVLCVYDVEDGGWYGFDDLCDGFEEHREVFARAYLADAFDNIIDLTGIPVKQLVELELLGG